MRHSFASNLATAGVSIFKIAEWLGDDVRVVQRTYAKRPRGRGHPGPELDSATFGFVGEPGDADFLHVVKRYGSSGSMGLILFSRTNLSKSFAFSIIAAPVSRRTASFGGCTI